MGSSANSSVFQRRGEDVAVRPRHQGSFGGRLPLPAIARALCLSSVGTDPCLNDVDAGYLGRVGQLRNTFIEVRDTSPASGLLFPRLVGGEFFPRRGRHQLFDPLGLAVYSGLRKLESLVRCDRRRVFEISGLLSEFEWNPTRAENLESRRHMTKQADLLIVHCEGEV